MQNYYNKIKDLVIDTETTIKVKDYTKNRVMLENYYEIGRLIVEAQGGEERAKYGNGLIKDYASKLVIEVDKKYSERTLRSMRQLYIMFKDNETIWKTLFSKSNWSTLLILLPLKNTDKISYYVNQSNMKSLTVRQLREKIKSKEYERLPDETKEKLKLNKVLSLTETITDPIIISNPENKQIIKEKELQKLIMENISEFLKSLGEGYSFIGNEYPVKIGDRYYKIDLLYNYKYKCFVIIELKIGELKHKDYGQIKMYMNYIDDNLKDIYDNKTIGIILCHKNNRLVVKYCSSPDILVREYLLN